ncbi:MAG TPA: class I SAM-dependent methyltransferase [Gemmatimonadaceae bacterium]|jgi:ubiquinone/menaquinone biosynthesis C-methylase UbiE
MSTAAAPRRGRFGSLIERADRLIGSYNAAPFYYDVVFRVASGWGVSCFNYGYSPVSSEVASDTSIGEPFQIEMYRQASQAVGQEKFANANVLEISCGLGGGLSYLSRTLGVGTPVALDRAGGGVRSAHKRFALPTVKADAMSLPVATASVDIVINVEASHVYFEPAFLNEVARVLKPSGTFVLIDSRDLTPAEAQAYLDQHLNRAGLHRTSFRDITQNVVDSCVADTPRRERLLKRLPFFVRPSLRPMLGVEGSSRYECFRSRKTTYFISTFMPASFSSTLSET